MDLSAGQWDRDSHTSPPHRRQAALLLAGCRRKRLNHRGPVPSFAIVP